MNILDLNDDIMSKIKHNLFLKSLMKHRDKIMVMVNEFDFVDWYFWEVENFGNRVSLDNGQWAHSADPEYWGEELMGDDLDNQSDLKLIIPK
eukprot:SAG11_NODE_1301_length_5259_cov_8.758140_4_plen_92_part_00